MIRLLSPLPGECVQVMTDEQKRFLTDPDRPYLESIYADPSSDHTKPLLIRFAWEGEGEDFLFEISPSADFGNAFSVRTGEKELLLNNFLSGAEYRWRVNGCEPSSFRTEDTIPRMIDLSGPTNVRDCGGWRCKGGRRYRQGMLYRGSHIEGDCAVTEEGRKIMTEWLGIRTELELRPEDEIQTANPVGLTYFRIPFRPYCECLSEEYQTACREIFQLFTHREYYPIYFHCYAGADRTGTIAFLLGVILGMSEKDLLTDYEITSLVRFGERSRHMTVVKDFLSYLWTSGKGNIAVGVYRYLYGCGITDEMLDEIRDILLTEEK